MTKIKIEIEKGKLKLLEDLRVVYKNKKTKKLKHFHLPAGTISDGGTSKYFANIIFSNKDYYQGTRAFFIHDFMCENKKDYKRKESTEILMDLWREDGFDKWKSHIVGFFINIYQLMVGGWKK